MSVCVYVLCIYLCVHISIHICDLAATRDIKGSLGGWVKKLCHNDIRNSISTDVAPKIYIDCILPFIGLFIYAFIVIFKFLLPTSPEVAACCLMSVSMVHN